VKVCRFRGTSIDGDFAQAEFFETSVRYHGLSQFRYSGLASQGHALIDSLLRFRDAGRGVVAALMRRKYYGEFAQES